MSRFVEIWTYTLKAILACIDNYTTAVIEADDALDDSLRDMEAKA